MKSAVLKLGEVSSIVRGSISCVPINNLYRVLECCCCFLVHFSYEASSDTQGQIVGARESLNGFFYIMLAFFRAF